MRRPAKVSIPFTSQTVSKVVHQGPPFFARIGQHDGAEWPSTGLEKSGLNSARQVRVERFERSGRGGQERANGAGDSASARITR